jgi:glycine oxidase
LPDVAQVRNPRLLKALCLDLERLGVPIYQQTQVESLMIEQGRCQGLRTRDGVLKADNLVLCTGAWTSELWLQLGPMPDIRPVRGQMILLAGPPGLLNTISMRQARYFVPRQDGRVLVGSTLEETGFECATTQAARDELLQVVRERVPALAEARLEHHWAGLRPATSQGIPYIGAHPEVEGLYINSGHYRNGLVLAPASARLLADSLLKRKPVLDPAPYGLMVEH